MNFYLNSEVSSDFQVSKPTVSKWIKDSIIGKNNLQIVEFKGKLRILKSEHNRNELIRLQKLGQKYKPSIHQAIIQADSNFFLEDRNGYMLEIILSIEKSREIPHKYTYHEQGAKIWDNYYKKNALDGNYPTPNRVKRLLQQIANFLNYKLNGVKNVNIFDIGQGNSDPVKDFIKQLNQLIRVKRYITIDISAEMNEISRINMNQWFPDIEFIGYVRDVEKHYFDEIFFRHKDDFDSQKSVNLILDLGSLIGLHTDPQRVLKNLSSGMGKADLLLISNTIDTTVNRVDFSYVKSPVGDDQNTWIPKKLGIEVEKCQLITKFDERLQRRVLLLKLDKDYILKVKYFNRTKEIILYKNEELILWQHQTTRVSDFINLIEEVGLKTIALITEVDYSHALFVTEINDLKF